MREEPGAGEEENRMGQAEVVLLVWRVMPRGGKRWTLVGFE